MLTVLGLAAGTLTTGCWVPQVLRTLRTRHTDDLAWGYLLLFGVGITLWTAYGVVQANPVIITPNAVSLVLVLAIVRVKAGNRRRSAAADPVDDALPALSGG